MLQQSVSTDDSIAIAAPIVSADVLPTVNTVVRTKAASYHTFLVNGSEFVVDAFYQPLKPVGIGAYGVVCSALDQTTGRKVAIKKIKGAYDDVMDAKRIVREIKLLHHLKHQNIVGLVDLINPPPAHGYDDIYMVLDFMETDLHKIIYSTNKLSNEHIQYFVYQLLCALKYLHSANVIHRDLKPSNLLVNGNCDLRICDFGLARGVSDANDYELTEYVVTRWYRAPEVMCACQQYDEKIDVWSTGCIMAELLGRQPIFPGDDYIHQMNLIFGILGTPSPEDIDDFITNPKAVSYVRSQKHRDPVPLTELYPQADKNALDLLERMLIFNPHKRISVEDALEHPYLRSLHSVRREPICDEPFNFDFEKGEVSKEGLQRIIYEEMSMFRPYLQSASAKAKLRNGSVSTAPQVSQYDAAQKRPEQQKHRRFATQ